MDTSLKRFSNLALKFRAKLLELNSTNRHFTRKFDLIDFLFLLILMLDLAVLFFMVNEISISIKELNKIQNEDTYLVLYIRFWLTLFGENDFALRGGLILIHTFNMIFMYLIGRAYLKKAQDSLYLIIIFALLPGINISALLLYKSVFLLFFLLLICLIHIRTGYIPYLFISICGLFNASFGVVFLALGAYSLVNKKTKTLLFSIIFFGINAYIFSDSIGGIPKAHFLDNLGELSMIFSPLLFVYVIYSLYAGFFRFKDNSLMIYIASAGFIYILLLSLRQNVLISEYAPLIITALPIFVYNFLNSYRVVLKQFRKRIKIRLLAVFGVLILETFLLFFNKVTYLFDKELNFASNYYIAKDLAKVLESKNVKNVSLKNENLAKRLEFYGLKTNGYYKETHYCLYENTNKKHEEINVVYLGKVVASYKLVKSRACRF